MMNIVSLTLVKRRSFSQCYNSGKNLPLYPTGQYILNPYDYYYCYKTLLFYYFVNDLRVIYGPRYDFRMYQIVEIMSVVWTLNPLGFLVQVSTMTIGYLSLVTMYDLLDLDNPTIF